MVCIERSAVVGPKPAASSEATLRDIHQRVDFARCPVRIGRAFRTAGALGAERLVEAQFPAALLDEPLQKGDSVVDPIRLNHK
jgi:hypothetical protein